MGLPEEQSLRDGVPPASSAVPWLARSRPDVRANCGRVLQASDWFERLVGACAYGRRSGQAGTNDLAQHLTDPNQMHWLFDEFLAYSADNSSADTALHYILQVGLKVYSSLR